VDPLCGLSPDSPLDGTQSVGYAGAVRGSIPLLLATQIPNSGGTVDILTAEQAIEEIRDILFGDEDEEWSPETLDFIADVIGRTE
jgi:hypothetical protein